eukprot:3180410-Rhodomonas_salina.2
MQGTVFSVQPLVPSLRLAVRDVGEYLDKGSASRCASRVGHEQYHHRALRHDTIFTRLSQNRPSKSHQPSTMTDQPSQTGVAPARHTWEQTRRSEYLNSPPPDRVAVLCWHACLSLTPSPQAGWHCWWGLKGGKRTPGSGAARHRNLGTQGGAAVQAGRAP